MKVLLNARNAMGVTADYEVDINSATDLQKAVHRLYALPGIVLVTMPDKTIKLLDEWPNQWEGMDNT
jgi:hypothetical protein